MTEQKAADVKDTAIKLDEIRTQHPEDYFYLKGLIHGLLQKEEHSGNHQQHRTKKII